MKEAVAFGLSGGVLMVDELRSMLDLMQERIREGLGEIPDERLDWRPTSASTTPAEIVWHAACVERRLAAMMRGENPDVPGAAAGTREWIEAAASGEADTGAVPRDRAGLEAALDEARRETLAGLERLSPEQLQERVQRFLGATRTRAYFARFIAVHHSYHAGQLFTLAALIRGGL
jgi:uncharacterized damage-inducible protein DinB